MENKQKKSRRDGLLPISVIGGLVGMLAGILPATFCTLIFGAAFPPFYVFLPLLIYLGIRLFSGFNGRRGLITVCIFSAIGFYLTLLSCQAAMYIIQFRVLFLSVPLVTMSLIGRPNVLPSHVFSSFYTFPFVFTLLGIFLSKELLMRKKEPAIDLDPEPETGDKPA